MRNNWAFGIGHWALGPIRSANRYTTSHFSLPTPHSHAFTLLEVLLSILLLFPRGLALLKCDGSIKQDLSRYREKASILYRETPLLYADIRSLREKKRSLYDVTRFVKLRDDEIFWLKNLEGSVKVGKEEKKNLFQSEDLDLTYHTYPLKLYRGQEALTFIRVFP